MLNFIILGKKYLIFIKNFLKNMVEILNKHFLYLIIVIIISLLLLVFYIYILILDKKLIKLENKIKQSFKKRLDFIPVFYDLTE